MMESDGAMSVEELGTVTTMRRDMQIMVDRLDRQR